MKNGVPKVRRHISNMSMGIRSRSVTLSFYQLFSLKLLCSLSLWGAPQELSDCIWFLNGLPALASLPPVDHTFPKARMLGGCPFVSCSSHPTGGEPGFHGGHSGLEVSGRDGCVETDRKEAGGTVCEARCLSDE